MDLDATAEARQLLLVEVPPEVSPVGHLWRVHAAGHLAASLDAYLRGGVRPPRTEDQALALLRAAARDLRAAGGALDVAARQFKARGLGWEANRTYHAAQEAARAAEAIDPT